MKPPGFEVDRALCVQTTERRPVEVCPPFCHAFPAVSAEAAVGRHRFSRGMNRSRPMPFFRFLSAMPIVASCGNE